MWVLYRTSDGRVVDIQAQRGADMAGATWLFIANATRDQLGWFVVNDALVDLASSDTSRRAKMAVTNRQFRRALRGRNVRDQFQAWLATAAEEHADYFLHEPILRRLHPSVEAARVGLSATHNQVDNFFIDAALIE